MSKVLESTAVPSTATPTTEKPEPTFVERQSQWTPEQKQHWKLTGREPEPPQPDKKDGEPAATTKVEAPKAAPESGPEKETKEPQTEIHRRLSRRDRKIGELSAENRRLQRELDAAKTAPKPNAPVDRTETAKPTARPKMPRLSDPKYNVEGGLSLFDADLERYETALDAYEDQRVSAKHQEFEKQRGEREVSKEVEAEFLDIQKDFHKRCGDYRKTNAEFDKSFTTVSTATQAAGAAHLDGFLLESQVGPALVDHLAKHPETLQELLELSPTRAVAKLGILEDSLLKAPIPKKTTSAPDPPERLGGKDQQVDGPPVGSREWKRQQDEAQAKRLLSR